MIWSKAQCRPQQFSRPWIAVDDAIMRIGRGEFVIVVDDVDRENEGDLILAADAATPEAIAFMVRYTSGVICVAMTGRRLDELSLPLMTASNTESQSTAFTVSVDVRAGTTSGISAADRASTIIALASPATRREELSVPGHVFPLRARKGGVLTRPGHTEASVDLACLAGRAPAGALSELVADSGAMMRGHELEVFAVEHRLGMISIAELVHYRRSREDLLHALSATRVPAKHGAAAVRYHEDLGTGQPLALPLGFVPHGVAR